MANDEEDELLFVNARNASQTIVSPLLIGVHAHGALIAASTKFLIESELPSEHYCAANPVFYGL